MKKTNLILGILYTVLGLAAMVAGFTVGGAFDGLLYGLAGAGIGPGVFTICKYFYLNSEKAVAKRQEKEGEAGRQLEISKDRAGRNAHILSMVITALSLILFAVLGFSGILDSFWLILIYLAAYLAAQIAIWVLLMKKAKPQKDPAEK